MAPSATSPKIEELRFRLKTDPKSRLFYPLAEELRKVGACADAEQVLRTGLTYHPSYLSAWVSLGRVAREQGKSDDAIEALAKALQLDPGNVVAARLLADSYLAAGEKVEAIKKYKLVHALMPGDSEVEAMIEQLDRELTPIAPAPEPEPEPQPEPEPVFSEPEPEPELAHSAAEEAIFPAAAVEVEAPAGFHVEEAPLGADVATPWDSEEEELPAPEPTDTVTMADLYARQGLVAEARRIYETILQRDPANDAVREKLAALDVQPVQKKIARLEDWLSKVSRREESHV